MADVTAGDFRIRYNNGQPEYTFNNGLTWQALGGGALGPIADQTLLGNMSGGPLAPSALTADQVRALLLDDVWNAKAIAAAKAYNATLAGTPLTGFRPFKFGEYSLGTTAGSLPALKGSAEGGGASGAAGALFYSVPIFQTPKAGPWFIRFAGKLRAQAGGVTDWFAVGDPTLADYITFGIANATDATHYISQMSHTTVTTNNVSAAASDANWHNFDLKFDGATFKCDVDGVNAISTATLTNFPALASAVFLISSAATFNAASGLYAYVDPRVLT